MRVSLLTKARRPWFGAVTLLTLLTSGCGAGPTASGTQALPTLQATSGATSSASPGASPVASPVARSYAMDVPDGWLAVDVTPSGLHEMAGRLQATWPVVSMALEQAANGGSTPFKAGQTLLAYDLRPEDLADYPTGFNVAESGGQIECMSLDLEADFRNSGITDVEVTDVTVPIGKAARVSGRTTGGPQDLYGATYAIRVDGRTFQAYFETRWDLRDRFEPTFDAIASSLRVTQPTPAPSGRSISDFPHDNPAFERVLPQSALGRPLCTWSIDGTAALELFADQRELQEGILADLNLKNDAFSVGVAGRVNDSDPPFIVTGYQYRGADPAKLLAEFEGFPGETRHIGAKTVYVAEGSNSPGHAEGLDYFYPTGIMLFWIKSADERWFEDVLDQLP